MAGGTWDKLEQVFEDRVSRALARLGVYTSSDVEKLSERVNELSEAVNALLKAQGVRRPPPSPMRRKAEGCGAQRDTDRTRAASGETRPRRVPCPPHPRRRRRPQSRRHSLPRPR